MRTFGLFLLLSAGVALRAEVPSQVAWDDVCKVAAGNTLSVTTASGENVSGYCVSVSVDEMKVRTTDGKVVRLARSAFDKVRLHRVKSGQLKALGRGVGGALHGSLVMLFSPLAPVGAVGVPGTVAWGAIALPFCALSDLHDKLHGTREIVVR